MDSQTPKNNRYNGSAFWNNPKPDSSPVASDFHADVQHVSQTQTFQPAEDSDFTAHPVITPQKNSSFKEIKKPLIIIAAATVVIALVTGVVIFELTTKSDINPSNKQENAFAVSSEIEKSSIDNSASFSAVSMPACENKRLSDCRSELENLGISVNVDYAFSNDVAEGCVVSQSITKGTELRQGEKVTLVVSKGAEKCPYDYQQKLTVTAASGSSRAKAVLYEWKNGDWEKLASYSAAVGSNGIGNTREGSSTSPEGIHKLGVVLSSGGVDTNLDTYHATSNTCVVDDTSSSYYNQIMEKSEVPDGVYYDNIGKGLTNGSTYATIYIEHNGSGFSSSGVVSGNGSAIGLRGQYGALSATYGDVDISADDMKDLLSRLDMSKKPMIELTVE